MGFSIKIAPGVRVRASSRGVRTSIGPRIARVHVGGGRTGFSTGMGPLGFYTSAGGGSRRPPSTGSVNRQLAAAARQQAAAHKQAQAAELARALQAILEIHRQDFPPMTRTAAEPVAAVDAAAVQAHFAKEAKRSTGVFSRAARKEALRQAYFDAKVAIDQQEIAAEQAHRARQAELDAWWANLERCDPGTVLATLGLAFEDNQAAAAAVGVTGTEVALVVVVPPESAIPERQPARTQAGNLTLKKLTKTELADFYKHMVCGHALVTLREAFAVVPQLTSARIVAVRASAVDAYGIRRPEVLLAGACTRATLQGVKWRDADAVRIFNDCLTDKIMIQKGATRALSPIPVDAEPELRALVEAIDMEEMAD